MSIDLAPIAEFMASSQRNAWLDIHPYRVYVRRATRVIEGKLVKTLDLANVVNCAGVYAGFWQIYGALCKAGKAAGCEYLYLENTYNERLHAAYVQRGCVPILDTLSLYKELS